MIFKATRRQFSRSGKDYLKFIKHLLHLGGYSGKVENKWFVRRHSNQLKA